MSDFRTVAVALAPFIKDSRESLEATDAVMRVVQPASTVMEFTADALDLAAFRSTAVLEQLRNSKLINAIKEHRAITGASLKQSKESCERVREALASADLVPGSNIY